MLSYAYCTTNADIHSLLYFVLFLFYELHFEEALASVYLRYNVPFLLHTLISAEALAFVYMRISATFNLCITVGISPCIRLCALHLFATVHGSLFSLERVHTAQCGQRGHVCISSIVASTVRICTKKALAVANEFSASTDLRMSYLGIASSISSSACESLRLI